MIHPGGKSLFAPRVMGWRPGPANITRHDPIPAPEPLERPLQIFDREAPALPIGRRVFRAQAIKIDRHVNACRPQGLDEL